jgi:hypothetical protein
MVSENSGEHNYFLKRVLFDFALILRLYGAQ